MAGSLIEHGAIKTTEAKAKELRRFVEKLITLAKKGTLDARRRAVSLLQSRRMGEYPAKGRDDRQTVIQKLFDEIAPRYLDRPGGYTRIIRVADRRIGDAGKQVIIQLVEEMTTAGDGEKGQTKRRKRAAKRHEAASAVKVEAEKAKHVGQDEKPGDQDAGDEQAAEEQADAEQDSEQKEA